MLSNRGAEADRILFGSSIDLFDSVLCDLPGDFFSGYICLGFDSSLGAARGAGAACCAGAACATGAA
jgi:hypothetical protein